MAFNMNSSEYSRHYDFEWATKLNRISLEVIGLWPKPARDYRDKLMCNLRTFIAVLACTVNLIVPCIHSLMMIYSDIILTVDNLIFTLPTITVAVKILIFWWKKETIMSIIIMIADDWLKSKSIQDKELMVRWAQAARIIITCTYCVMGILYFFFIMLPGFGIATGHLTNNTDRNNLLPVQVYYMYDISKSPQYEITYISQIISLFFLLLAYTGIHNLLGLLILHICGQLRILKNRLKYLHKFSNFYASLKCNVMDHRRLLRAINIVEDTYNMIFFTLFLYFGILFAFYGVLIINLLEKGNELSVFRLGYLIMAIILIFGNTFLYCLVGEILTTHCDEIYYAICKQEWYSLHSKNMKDLIFLLIRSSKPIYLTVGKVFPMTMSTFCSLIKTSTGYISVLLTSMM